MKKIFFAIFISIASLAYSQSSIQPNLGLNTWTPAFGSMGFVTTGIFEIGADYEYAIKENIGISGGASYNMSFNSYGRGGGIFEINAGGRYNIKKLNDGLFLGADIGLGFPKGGSTIFNFVANVGYSIPIGNGSLNPNVSLGYMSNSKGGLSLRGIYLPINVSYSILIGK
jgi:hypothetical protein